MSPPAVPADAIDITAGLKADFFKRHRKDRTRAEATWRGLAQRRDALIADCTHGLPLAAGKWPPRFRHLRSLFLVPGLPHRFRALYTVFRNPLHGVVLEIVWIGDHFEYDALFGYRTS